MAYNFKEDLSFGSSQEQFFLSFFGGRVSQGSGRKEDLILDNGELLELKSERYFILDEPKKGCKKTSNLFIEFEGNDGKEKGPWRAKRDGCKWYVHLFLDGVVFVFETEKLCAWLEANKSKFKTHFIENDRNGRKWWINGYKVPAVMLKMNKIGRIGRLYNPNQDYSQDDKDKNAENLFNKVFKNQ